LEKLFSKESQTTSEAEPVKIMEYSKLLDATKELVDGCTTEIAEVIISLFCNVLIVKTKRYWWMLNASFIPIRLKVMNIYNVHYIA